MGSKETKKTWVLAKESELRFEVAPEKTFTVKARSRQADREQNAVKEKSLRSSSLLIAVCLFIGCCCSLWS